ncbi:MAG TPA: serine protease [Candidatus Binatia bacterium]|jgi:S1-C subfamily serine protease|nr:serine protease [Candidatus Binatia bacterium]
MFVRTIIFSLVCIGSLVSCSCGTTYVRVPAVCPQDPLCLDTRPGSHEAPARERDFVRRHVASTVEVRGSRYLPNKGPAVTKGVGAFVGSKGYVLTAYHLVDGAEQVSVVLRTMSPDGRVTEVREVPAIPLVLSREADMALLALPMSERPPPSLPVRTGPVIKGDPVWFIGARTALRHGGVAETGILDGPNRDHADASIPSPREDAGAPVLNVCGEIVGVSIGPYGKNGALRFMPIDAVLASLSMSVADLR